MARLKFHFKWGLKLRTSNFIMIVYTASISESSYSSFLVHSGFLSRDIPGQGLGLHEKLVFGYPRIKNIIIWTGKSKIRYCSSVVRFRVRVGDLRLSRIILKEPHGTGACSVTSLSIMIMMRPNRCPAWTARRPGRSQRIGRNF